VKRLALVLYTCLSCAKGIPLPDATATQPIPAGSYLLGGGASICASSQSLSCGAATPARPTVLTRSFDIDVYEVTVKQFAACAALDQCCGENLPDYLSHGDEPVFVTLDQARQYCRFRNRRLPTEAEWEVAARLKDAQGDLQVYPWGDSARACGDVPSSECGGNNNPRTVGTNTRARRHVCPFRPARLTLIPSTSPTTTRRSPRAPTVVDQACPLAARAHRIRCARAAVSTMPNAGRILPCARSNRAA